MERHILEGVEKIEERVRLLRKEKMPIEGGLHIEFDDRNVLSAEGHKWFCSLIGMALWVALLDQLNFLFSVMQLTKF